jgi:hypothetical protein
MPGMLEAGFKLIMSLVDGMVKNLPAAFKKLAAALPSILKSLLASAPQMVSALFEIAASLVGDLIGMLPELVPMILEGVAKVLLSVGDGVLKILGSMFDGIGKLLGVKGDEFSESINGLFGNVDKEKSAELSATVKASLTTEVTTDDYTKKINDAVAAIQTALTGIPALDDTTKAEIQTAIANGTGLPILQATLEALNVDPTVAAGIVASITTAMDTISTTLKDLGLSDEAQTAIDGLIANNASAAEIQSALESFGVKPEAAASAATTITDEMGKINAAIGSIGLTPEATAHINTLIASNATPAEITKALVSYGIAKDAAKSAAETITTEMDKISAAVNGLGLTEAAQKKITDMAVSGASNADIVAALVSFGVTPGTAQATADTITTEMGLINGAVDGLGIDPTTKAQVLAGVMGDKASIINMLKTLGVPQDTLDTVAASYDTASGSLTAKASALLTGIATAFTDGSPDDEEAAKKAVKAFYTDVNSKIDTWKAEAQAELEASGLTGSALEEKTAAIEESWTSMTEAAKQSETGAMNWVEENANRSTEFVNSNLTALQTILTEAQKITAQIDVLTNAAFDTARNRRTLVKKGVVTNEAHQLEALGITSMELDENLQNADNTAAQAFEKAATEFADDAEGYKAEEKRILDKLAADKAAAYAAYNTEIAAIIAGIVKANPELADQLSGVQELVEKSDLATKLRQKIADALSKSGTTGEPVDLKGFFDNLTAEGIDITKLAESLGMTPEELQTAIANELKTPEGGGAVTTAINDLISGEGGLESQIATKLKEGGVDLGGTGTVLSTAITDGYLKSGVDGVDWTSYETLFNTMLAGVGQAGVDGLGSKTDAAGVAASVMGSTAVKKADVKDGMKTSGENSGQGWLDGWRDKVVDMVIAAYQAGKAVKKAFDRGQAAASPSKAFKESGMFSGQGWEIGFKESMAGATKTARSLAQDVAGVVNLPPRMAFAGAGATGGTLDVMGALRGMFDGASFNMKDRQDMQVFAYEFMGILNNQIRAVGGSV